jgi:multimeric flavodoxin WrbA
MKVTVFNGSPRGRESNSHKIVAQILTGAEEAGAETEEIFLVEKDIKQCRGCFDCWGKTPGICTIKDDMPELMNLFLGSDFAGLATPVYGMLMTGLLKNFTDRLLPLATPHIHKNEDGSFYHEGRLKRFPRQFYVANSGFPGEHNFDFLKAYAGMQNMVLEVYRNSGEVLGAAAEHGEELMSRVKKFNEALKKAGREMVTAGQVSEDTVKDIHLELISDDEYMKRANEYWDEEIGKGEKD